MEERNTTLDSAENSDQVAAEQSGQTTSADSRVAERDQLIAERDQLAAEKAEIQDRLLRKAADFDNYRRRVERERAEVYDLAGMDVVRSLLPVLDDFERALNVASLEDEFAKGMQLIYQRLADTLKKLGVEPIESVGQPFDPYIHHAVEMVETDEHEDHTVLSEFQKGYNFRGRLVRPAMVKVAVKP